MIAPQLAEKLYATKGNTGSTVQVLMQYYITSAARLKKQLSLKDPVPETPLAAQPNPDGIDIHSSI